MVLVASESFGKVILLGEHAVVYGHPCLAAGISPGASAVWHRDAITQNAVLTMTVDPLNATSVVDDDSDLGKALGALVRALDIPLDTGKLTGEIKVKLHLPPGGGLGSSAAIGVAVAKQIGEHWFGSPLTYEQTIHAAQAWERIFHGNPSGVDHTMATIGGAGVFTRVTGYRPIVLKKPLRILIADTMERSPTKEMVANVAKLYERKRSTTEQTLEAIGTIVKNGELALADHDLKAFGQLMDLNQVLLSSLFVSSERIELLCRTAREHGALGAKLTGGGGGGCVIAITETDTEEHSVISAWKALNAPTFSTVVTS